MSWTELGCCCENRKEHFMSPIDPVTSEDYTYTYEWVTDTGGSRPSSHLTSQVKGRDHTSQTTVQSSQRMSSLSKENVKRKSSPTEQTNSDAYTYDWVTDSGSRQTGPVSSHASKDTASQTLKIHSCPSSMGQQTNTDTHDKSLVRISQNLGRSKTKHTEKDRKPHGYLNSTKRPDALSIFHAKFPVDLSVITSSPSHGKEKTVLHYDASPITAGSGKQVQRMNSTRKKDGLDIDMIKLPDMSVIERICPLEKQPTCMDQAKTVTGADKVPLCLSSTRKNGGLDFDKANFSLDVSEIKELSCVEDRQGHIQLLQENTPKARQTKQDAVTPMKSASVITKKKRKLLPKSSTVLFVSGYTGELIHPTPSLSAITSSQNTVYTSDHPDIARDSPVKKAKIGSGEKQLYIDSGPNSIWKEESVTQGKILTSTPVASTQTRFQRPEVNLTCVPRQCFEDELEFNESIEVNSDEIVPEDFTEEDISVENLEKSSGGRQKPELNSSSSKIDFLKNQSVGSALQTSKTNFRGKLSVKPITASSMISKMTECCLVDPSISFPRRKYTLYRKISEEMFKGSAAVSEDILLTHSFKRR